MKLAVAIVRCSGLAYTAASSASAKRSPKAAACCSPSSESATSVAPAKRSSALSTVAPCRISSTRVVIASSSVLRLRELREVAYGAARGAGRYQRVGLQSCRNIAIPVGAERIAATRFGRFAAPGQRALVDQQLESTIGDVDRDAVTFFDQGDRAAFGRFRRDVTDAQARRAAAEPSIRDQRAGFAQAFALQERSRIQHLLHARAAFGALVRDDHDVARLDLIGHDGVAGGVLRVEEPRGAFEFPD